MQLLAIARIISKSNPLVMLKAIKMLDELYRSAFLSTAVAEGVHGALVAGPRSGKELHDALGLSSSEEELEAWLDVGVSLGELAKDSRGYRLKGRLSRELAKPENDHLHGFLQARVEVMLDYVVKTPAALRAGRRFTFDDAYGEVFARSSRTVEPMLLELIPRLAPTKEGARQLEVGCGSGVYIVKACELNPTLTVVGLEASSKAADLASANLAEAGLEDRAHVEVVDVRDFADDEGFDVITLFNLIYYFPESERVELLSHLRSLLKPGGLLALATLTPAMEPSTTTMNLWSTMTEGCGPLPRPDVLAAQLDEAGFDQITSERVLRSSFMVFTGTRPR